ncbi:uncharacterized protein BYT42DRAFT_575320 [Radiomyces spectabilis]|uniref:uncharacterized protein n=1 Tax=Radiomyces spectabilis TaxID=64574 RepID=UPI00221E7C29|nr:uncharacterized protein BYT42DRAFT_575320 [Radiomyces spectabilis]KAI8374163.1 hypothetical protein BYT42DRAFT_575320 [Radiomyces spectabilis]
MAVSTEVHQNLQQQQQQKEPKQSHPGLFKIVRQGPPEAFSSKLVTERPFEKGAVIVNLTGLTPGPKRYSSVQISENDHIELNSDLLYMNHSCDPSVDVDVSAERRAIIALKELKAGDEMTFFYPSTEWDMAQPFTCWCGADKCIKTVKGARYIDTEILQQFQLSQHIKDLTQRRDA